MKINIILLAIFFIFFGCEKNNGISLALDWYPNSNHAGIYAALEEGYFDEENLNLEVYTPSDPTAIISSVASGRDEFGLSYAPDILRAQSVGLEIVSVLSIAQHPLNSIMTLRERKINSPKDLEGLKIGYPGIPSNKAMLETVLNSEGLTIDDVEILDVGFELVRALISGSVDAIIGAYWTHESIVMDLQGFEVDVMRLEEWGVPDYYELVLIVNKDFLVNNDSEVEKMISAFSKGYEYAINHPEDSINSIIKIAGKEIVEEDVEQKGIKLLIPIWSDSIKFGYQDLQKWEETYNWMKKNEFLENDFNINDFIYTKYSNQ